MIYIEISGLIFKCAADESIFISRLYELHGIDNVVSKGVNVHLALSNTFNEAAFKELQIICDIWGSTFKVINNEA